ncbi:MAG: transposase [Saprospiraceae bacterium]
MLNSHQDRNQLQMLSFDSAIDKNSIVRVIDVVVDLLNLKQIDFIIKGQIKNGAPAFHTADLLKLYFYGYSNLVRSSRRLQREIITHLEVIWLNLGAVLYFPTHNNTFTLVKNRSAYK